MKSKDQLYRILILLVVALFTARTRAEDGLTMPVTDASAPADILAFQKQLVNHINQQRPKWSQAQWDDLSAFVCSHLQKAATSKLTAGNAALILKYFGDNMSRMGMVGNPDNLTVQYNREFLRWEIDLFGARAEMLSSEKAVLEASITNCFAKASEKLHTWNLPQTHPKIDEIVISQMEKTIRALRDPLYPGLKHPISADEFHEYFATFCTDFQTSVSAIDDAETLIKCHSLNPTRAVNRCDVALNRLRISISRCEEYDEQLRKVSTALGEIYKRKYDQLIQDINSAAKSNDSNAVQRVIENSDKESRNPQ